MPGRYSNGGAYAGDLRRELCYRSQQYAKRRGLTCRESVGNPPVTCFQPSEDGQSHGNFLPETYQNILRHDAWRWRLEKVHTQGRSSFARYERRLRELDSCNSSDALLMNIFCHPETLAEPRVFDLLGVEYASIPEFGVKARVALQNGRRDRTEVDMKLGNLLVESKLTESDFQSRESEVVEGYRNLKDVFDRRRLPKRDGCYISYQLIRNVLAAHDMGCSFCVMLDARRPDLQAAWFEIMSCVRPVDLRTRCKVLTWQELAEALPAGLQDFLDEKYGIAAHGCASMQSMAEVSNF